jgi:hypothetical protein
MVCKQVWQQVETFSVVVSHPLDAQSSSATYTMNAQLLRRGQKEGQFIQPIAVSHLKRIKPDGSEQKARLAS